MGLLEQDQEKIMSLLCCWGEQNEHPVCKQKGCWESYRGGKKKHKTYRGLKLWAQAQLWNHPPFCWWNGYLQPEHIQPFHAIGCLLSSQRGSLVEGVPVRADMLYQEQLHMGDPSLVEKIRICYIKVLDYLFLKLFSCRHSLWFWSAWD